MEYLRNTCYIIESPLLNAQSKYERRKYLSGNHLQGFVKYAYVYVFMKINGFKTEQMRLKNIEKYLKTLALECSLLVTHCGRRMLLAE